MSGGKSCTCIERDSNNWVVLHYKHNHSYFERPKGAEHYSEYSTVHCVKCNSVWRTKANYVERLQIVE